MQTIKGAVCGREVTAQRSTKRVCGSTCRSKKMRRQRARKRLHSKIVPRLVSNSTAEILTSRTLRTLQRHEQVQPFIETQDPAFILVLLPKMLTRTTSDEQPR